MLVSFLILVQRPSEVVVDVKELLLTVRGRPGRCSGRDSIRLSAKRKKKSRRPSLGLKRARLSSLRSCPENSLRRLPRLASLDITNRTGRELRGGKGCQASSLKRILVLNLVILERGSWST